MLDLSKVRHQFDDHMRRTPLSQAGEPACFKTPHVTRHEGQIIWQDVAATEFDALIAGEIAHAAALSKDLEWKLYSHDAPVGLGDALERAGFVRQPTETILVRSADLGEAPDIADLTVHKVTTLDDAKDVFDLLFNAFGSHREVSPETLLHNALNLEPVYVARYNGIAVATGRLSVITGCAFGGLYGGASHKEYRRRGFYRPVVFARCNAALAAGCEYVFSEALPTSRPILQALGFERLCEVTGFIYSPTH
jgi:hypothetical protein